MSQTAAQASHYLHNQKLTKPQEIKGPKNLRQVVFIPFLAKNFLESCCFKCFASTASFRFKTLTAACDRTYCLAYQNLSGSSATEPHLLHLNKIARGANYYCCPDFQFVNCSINPRTNSSRIFNWPLAILWIVCYWIGRLWFDSLVRFSIKSGFKMVLTVLKITIRNFSAGLSSALNSRTEWDT